MTEERTPEGWVVRLKPRGIGRFFTAAFLGFWLCGWAAGEAFALWILVQGGYALLTGTPPDPGRAPLQLAPSLAAGAFLLFWLALWTLGGIGAIAMLLQLLWGEDRIVAKSDGVTLRWFRGPFRGTREVARDRLRGFDVTTRRGTLILETDRERIELSNLGTLEEREAAARSLRSAMGLGEPRASLELPKGWEEIITPEGERAVVQNVAARRIQARVATGAAVLLSAVAFALLREAGRYPELIPMAAIAGAATAALVWGAVWLAYGRTEVRIGGGAVTVRRRFRSKARDLFVARRLEIDVRSDSDGDEWFSLDGLSSETGSPAATAAYGRSSSKDRRTIVSSIHDPAVPRLLGSWIARAADVPLEDRSTREAREADVARLTEQLARAGPLGRAAALLLRKGQERREKSA